MTAPWLTVIGIGEDGRAGLPAHASAALDAAELVIGGRRHLALVGALRAPCEAWRSPLQATLERIAGWHGRRCVVLASGDPSWFGVARLLRERFGAAAVAVLPAPSAFSLAAARLGWSLEDCRCLSAHGHPVAALRRHLQRGRRLLVLTDGAAAPELIGELLGGAGFPDAEVTVLERLGGEMERVSRYRADAVAGPFAELNLVAVDLRPCAATGWALLPGLADAAYEHDGQLTKSELRALALARLAPLPGERLWDVGAGSGSVAIEWLRAESGTTAIAVERVPERSRRIRANAARLGVPELDVVEGTAPACLAGLPPPAAVFVGGGCRDEGVLDACWAALGAGGRLVAHAVTIESERALLAFQARHGGELCRIGVAHAEPVGRLTGWRPTLPVTQLVVRR